jgi:TolB-like protein
MPESGGTVNGQNRESPSPAGSSFARDVFVSYASQDAAVANSVVEALERHSISCWIAPRDVIAGEFYADAIVHAIDTSRVLVLILSPHAVASPHILREVERASAKRHPVISLRIERAELPSGLEYFLNTSQWLDASNGETARALPKLIEAVRRAQQGVSARTTTTTAPPSIQSSSPPHKSKSLIAILCTLIIGVALAFTVDKIWLSKHTSDAPKNSAAISAFSPQTGPAAPEKSVAVLPFVDMSEKKDQEYFSDGMSEELIDMLTKIPDLRIPARTSSFYFKGKPTTIADIAKTLGVAYVLEGSVRKSGSVLRVTAQLIRVDTGYHLWSETYDRQLDDVFKVQDDIARAVVSALKASLLGKAPPESAGTQSIEAYDLYLWARSNYVKANTRTDYEKVAEYLRKTLAADPQFANAWALLSRVVATQGQGNYVPAKEAIEESRRAANRALELNPRLPDAHTAVAKIYVDDDLNIRRGEAEVQQALALDPNNSFSLSWAAWLAAYKGEFDQAIALAHRSIDSDPVNSNRYENLASILYNARKYPEALAAIRKHDDLSPGANGERSFSPFIKLASGDPAGALAAIESEPELATNCGCRVLALDALGRKYEADLALANLEKHHANDNATGIAKVYASRRDLDQAFKWFDRSYQQHEYELLWIKVDPLVRNVQTDPRFNTLLKKLGLQD